MACLVPGCPALAMAGGLTCGPHRTARLAKGLVFDGLTLSRLACRICHRKLRPEDFVVDEPNRPPRHVACAPTVPRVKKRDEPKPLLDADRAQP